MALVKMSRKRLVYLTVSLFLVLATMTSTSQSIETECIGWWCRPRRSPPPQSPQGRINCFTPYSLEHCNDRDCGHTCSTHGFHFGGYCKQDYHPICCCR
ncbi:hypothetical protein SETIT_8G147400v2 [Setaria italica]|uniref:Knottin scorpion toxin-like domain-containing protein n=2 Tax=Setaria TaxID=4554 RepID=K3ZKH4_SETIT|nr:hypothetical protein SETIT_8G147400v2 [Setaria italica]TKW01118.1 hypothetical protein SEVIR_8G157300v2 [Setaria viridis]